MSKTATGGARAGRGLTKAPWYAETKSKPKTESVIREGGLALEKT